MREGGAADSQEHQHCKLPTRELHHERIFIAVARPNPSEPVWRPLPPAVDRFPVLQKNFHLPSHSLFHFAFLLFLKKNCFLFLPPSLFSFYFRPASQTVEPLRERRLGGHFDRTSRSTGTIGRLPLSEREGESERVRESQHGGSNGHLLGPAQAEE